MHLTLTAKLFMALFAAMLTFGGVILLAVEFVLPRYRARDKVLTPADLMRRVEEETARQKAERPDEEILADEVIAEVKARYGEEIAQPKLYDTVTKFMRIVLVGAILMLFFILYLYARSFTRPLLKLNSAAKKIAALDFSDKVNLGERTDELGQLSDSINEMSDRLNETLTELQDKNEALTAELERARELDRMRKKFVSDVSHELKTPLSIISGYAESLSIGLKSEEKRAKYSGVITDEAARMSRLVNELLQLSHYESGEFALKPVEFDFGELLNQIAVKYEDTFVRNGIRFISETAGGRITADPDRLEQVITNFLNNAVSHTDGDKLIYMRGAVANGGVDFSVVNAGAHIPPEDIDNIWTYFYRADPARNRSEGRFGIGLSICRALLTGHGAEFGARNVTNLPAGGAIIKTGVEFWFKL
jgi:signal transduction histidine kinase